jgi:hypothetical protein
MKRTFGFLTCAILGLALVFCSLLMPAHLRVVDASILSKAGGNRATVVDRGLALSRDNDLGAAQLLFDTANREKLPGSEKLAASLNGLAAQHPEFQSWGGGAKPDLAAILNEGSGRDAKTVPITEFAVRRENRAEILALLQSASLPAVQELLRTRALTNTVLMPPSSSASGQAFDTAVAICGLLAEQGKLTPEFTKAVDALAHEANRGANSQRLEQMLLDLMALGQRLNWDQLAVFAGQLKDTETLRLLANLAQQNEGKFPELFALTVVSGKPEAVAAYLLKFSQTGWNDLARALRSGAGGVDELLRRDQRLYSSAWRERLSAQAPFGAMFDLAAYYCWRTPQIALMVKWLLYLAGGCLLAASLHYARRPAAVLERPLQVRGFHVAREILFGLGFLFVVLLLSEPFLAQDSQKVEMPFRLRIPTVGAAAQAGIAGLKSTFMNEKNMLTLLLFFVLQALLYVACLVKLAEVRRQKVPARVKLKLLKNEDHLFDAGLYLGFVGTIISLILVSLKMMEFSIMAAYSSTSFGIIFVSIFKIFHLRPFSRTLLLEEEAARAPEPARRVEPAAYAQSA